MLITIVKTLLTGRDVFNLMDVSLHSIYVYKSTVTELYRLFITLLQISNNG